MLLMKPQQQSNNTTVLVACNADALCAVEHVLSEYKDCLHYAFSFDEARNFVLGDRAPDLVIIEMSFDGDRMFDLMKLLARRSLGIPVICFRGQPSRLLVTCDQAVAAVVKLIANAEFWDLSLVPDGNDGWNEKRAIAKLLSKGH
jgi:hypothetical protein